MGNLGFMFGLDCGKQVVVFIFSNKFYGNIILGDQNFINKDAKYLFLSKELNLLKFHILDDFKYKYSKIKVFNQRIVDFKDFVFYFKPKQYKEFKNLFHIENKNSKIDEILIKNVLEIYEIL